ncbi:hypothetical protein WBG78_17880 [Chryseolinea sp. T2]|uniref:DUF6913 domain-containing protein n=1 Tax=Chryseolinea sp. T2 TaxID=3129255 RepID=UPI0030788B6C
MRTEKLLQKDNGARGSVSYAASRNVGVLFSVEDKAKHEVVKEFIRKLEHDGKQVKVMEYLAPDKQNFEFKFDFFTENDISFWGKITSANALKFADTPFDYLVYLDTEPNPLMMHLLAMSKAKCRVGRQWEGGPSYFEFMVQAPSSVKELTDTIHRYIIQLK